MRVLGKRVVIEEIATKKENKVILLEKNAKTEELYDLSYKIVGVSDEVTEVKVGDIPILTNFAKPHHIEVIEKSDNKVITHSIFYLTDIAGIR